MCALVKTKNTDTSQILLFYQNDKMKINNSNQSAGVSVFLVFIVCFLYRTRRSLLPVRLASSLTNINKPSKY